MTYEEFKRRYGIEDDTPHSAQSGPGESQTAPATEQRMNYDQFLARYGIAPQEKQQAVPGGPLSASKKGGGQTAAASTTQKEPEKKSFLQSIQEGWQSTPIGKAMLESKPEKNSSLEKPSNNGVLDSLTKNGLYRQSDALKQRLQANANEGNPLAQIAQYAADQTVNTVKGVGSILTGNPYDYYSEYAEDWKKVNDQKYTPFEMAANTVGRNVYAGLGQLQGGLASTADMLLPDQITPEPVQESLDWMKQSTENVNNWANEFNQETGQTVLPQVLQAAGGMAPDLALAFATGGASLAGKAPQLAAASTGKLQAARQIMQQVVENPQFWLSFTRTWGNDYEEAKARGASEEQAVAAGALSSLLNAQIEVGGGVQTQFADDAKKGLKGVLQNALEEGSEEVKQNLVTNAANKLVFDRTAPIVSTSDETAVLNPGREAASFAVGALAGGMMGAPGALRRGNGIMDLFPAVDEQPQNTYNQGKGVIENGGQANPDLGGNVPVDGGAVYSGGGGVEHQPGGNGQGVSGAAGAGGQGTAQTDAARAQAVTGKDLRSSTTRQLRDLYTKWYAGQITPEEMEFESTRIAKSLVNPKEFSIQPDDSALARAEYLKSTPIYVNQDEKQILLNQFGTKTIPQLNIKLGTKFTETPNGAIGLDVAVQEMAGSGLGVTETGSAVDDISKAVGRPRAEIDEDMVNAQVEYIRDKIYSGGENKQTFDEWLAVASEDSEWGAPAEYVQRIAERYGIGPGADTGIDPNLQSLFDSDPMAAPKDNFPIDMQALYDTDLSGTTDTSTQPVDAPDEYGIASLFRSDPQGPGLSDQAQIDAQTSMREYQEIDPNTLTEEQKRLAGLTGDLVKDTFARHPITQRVNYGQEASEIRQAEADKKALQKEWDQYRRASSSTRVEEADAKQIAAGEKTMEQLSRGSRPEVVQDLADIQHRIAQSKQTGLQAQKRSIFENQQAIFKGVLEGINDPAELVTKENVNVSKLNRRTPERVMRYVFGERLGQELSDLLIRPIHANESAKVQFINQMFDEAKKLDLNLVERKLAQLVGEGTKGKNGSAITIGDIENRNITEESLPGHITKSDRDYILKHLGEADPKKVETAVSFYRQCYDSIREVVNDFRLEHGLTEIGKQENYFPHFNEDDPLTKTLKQLGLEGANGLPTSISGETAWFRPNSRYVAYFQERRGPETTYDSDLGFQSYMNAVADMLYHTDDIMRLRNFDAVIRGKSKDVDIANTIDSILGKKNLQLSDSEVEVMDKILQGEYMDMEASRSYSSFAQWLTNYTNKLANKQLFGDRWVEEKFGRLAYNLANKMEARFGRNSVVGNIASALNNTITLPKILATTDQKYVARAIAGLRSGELKNLAAESEFLQGKKGVRQLVESPTQKIMRMVSSSTFEPIEEAVSDVAFYAKYLEQMDKNGGNSGAAAATANDYAANMMARRSKGARPLNMESKDPLWKLFTMFQTEVSNDWYSLTQDLPDYVKNQAKLGNGKEAAKKIAAGAGKYVIYSYALNTLLEAITGYAPAPDILRWLWEFGAAIFNDEEEDTILKAAKATGKLGSELLNQVPGASTAMAFAGLGEGRVPLPEVDLAQAGRGIAALFDNPEESPNKYSYAADQLWNGIVKPGLFYTVLPFGGNQLRKTIEGGTTLVRGGAYKQTKTGEQLQTEVNNDITTPSGLANMVKGTLFGKSAISEVGDFYDAGGKAKSEKYTEAQKAGYEQSVLEQLFPTSTQSTGNVSYEKLTGGAEGAAEVDNWLNQLAENTGKDSMLPNNTTPNITADGEKVELSGTDMMEYAQTKQETSYSILSALYPVADTIPEAAQASYASAAQDYAAAVAKEAVAGVAPAENSWIAKVQDQAGVSGTEVTDELLNVMLARAIINSTEGSKNTVGQTISGSKKRNAIQALQDAGFSGQGAVKLYNLLG
ncbi:MAG: hypothetical protein KH315_11440 [Faecalibacterium prausnitzii]|uniref:Uncharacterized protein n=1 Tax=Faecalibacterium prausnitzii TaxID=853 RepID=A0A9E1M0E1_9FIRM|nr:hypothetical protein [Faecalibacterium prausnitzii]